MIDYILGLPGNEGVESVNPVVGETNDGFLNDIRGRHVRKEHVLAAIRRAAGGPVEEGSVGAGTGTICYGFKGGIGTSRGSLPARQGGYTVGVLVQTNHGGVFQIGGVPVAEKLRRDIAGGPAPLDTALDPAVRGLVHDRRRHGRAAGRPQPQAPGQAGPARHRPDGRILFQRKRRLRRRLFDGQGSPRPPPARRRRLRPSPLLRNDAVSPLFLAAAEAAEEAILNSLFKAHRVEGQSGHVAEALPLDKLRDLLK